MLRLGIYAKIDILCQYSKVYAFLFFYAVLETCSMVTLLSNNKFIYKLILEVT